MKWIKFFDQYFLYIYMMEMDYKEETLEFKICLSLYFVFSL